MNLLSPCKKRKVQVLNVLCMALERCKVEHLHYCAISALSILATQADLCNDSTSPLFYTGRRHYGSQVRSRCARVKLLKNLLKLHRENIKSRISDDPCAQKAGDMK